MPYRGPRVLPDADMPLAAAIRGTEAGVERGRARRRQDEQDSRLRDLFDLQFHEEGGRRGEAPPDDRLDRLGDLSTNVSTVPAAPPGPSADGSGRDANGIDVAALSAALQGNIDPGFARPAPAGDIDPGFAQAGTPDVDPGFSQFPGAGAVQQGEQPPAPKPGALVPGMGFSGINGPRYVQLEPHVDRARRFRPDVHQEGTYIDTEQTPTAERQRDRMMQLATAALYRRGDIMARGDVASGLEGQRQGGRLDLEGQRQLGRLDLRERITQGALANTALAALLRGQNEKSHDIRVNNFGGAANQREGNALRAAQGVLQAAGGDYNAAVDWLQNTDAGQQAARAGMRPDHLYSALGTFAGHETDQASMAERGPLGKTPGEATRERARTRTNVTAGRTPDPEHAAKTAWARANPPQPGETREQYHARYAASQKKPAAGTQ